MRSKALKFLAFLNGGLVMILEITGARLIAPFYGTTFFVWSSLISIILAALSVGYYWGGKLADHPRRLSWLLYLLWASGLALTALIFLKEPIFGIFASTYGNKYWLLVITTVLFAPVTIIFGMISPLIVRISLQGITNTGQTVGQLYAVSTIGSIAGTLLAGYVLLGLIGSTAILWFILIVIGIEFVIAWQVQTKKQSQHLMLLALLFIMIISCGLYINWKSNIYVADIDTQYSRFLITDSIRKEKRIRSLTNDYGFAQAEIDLDHPENLTSKYHQLFTSGIELKPDTKRILAIGGGAFVFPQHIAKNYPDIQVDVVEIDPKLIEVSKSYFFFEELPNLIVHHADGRQFLLSNNNKYDLIFIDAFAGRYIPFHLVTQEFISQLNENLETDGIVITNLIGIQQPSQYDNFLNAIYHTFGTEYSYQNIIPTSITNINSKDIHNYVLISSNRPLDYQKISSYQELYQLSWQPTSNPFIFTDDYAPVEHLADY